MEPDHKPLIVLEVWQLLLLGLALVALVAKMVGFEAAVLVLLLGALATLLVVRQRKRA